jgi:hypothetical protein
MLWASFGVLALVTIVFVALSGFYLEAIREEAPHLFEAWGRPSIGRYVWRRRSFIPFSRSVSARTYREELAAFPRSRAWASWLFVAHWAQVLAVSWCLVAIVRGGA